MRWEQGPPPGSAEDESGRERGEEGTYWSLKLPPETPAKGVRVSVSKGSVCEHALCSVRVWDQGSDHDQG